MAQKPILQCISIAASILVIALLLLPGIAGLIEGDFGYLRWQIDRGWNNTASWSQALGEIYAWSFWRLGLLAEEPELHINFFWIEITNRRIT